MTPEDQLNILIERYSSLSVCKNDIQKAYELLVDTFSKKGKLLVTGNGGSAADSEHIVGELMKGFCKKRPLSMDFQKKLQYANVENGYILGKGLQGALPAIALDGHIALSTAFQNDCNPQMLFAQQVNGYGMTNDSFLGISTSGNSENVCLAATVAKAKDMHVIALTGAKESRLSKFADCCIRVPETETYRIQELHLPVYHCLCLMLEEHFFAE